MIHVTVFSVYVYTGILFSAETICKRVYVVFRGDNLSKILLFLGEIICKRFYVVFRGGNHSVKDLMLFLGEIINECYIVFRGGNQ